MDPTGRSLNRRRVRRGTSSCWECRRRKIRCIFPSSPGLRSICIPCQQRGVKCIGQEFPEETVAPLDSRYHQVGQRIVHVEGLVRQLLQQRARHSARVVREGRKSSSPAEDTDTRCTDRTPSRSLPRPSPSTPRSVNGTTTLPPTPSMRTGCARDSDAEAGREGVVSRCPSAPLVPEQTSSCHECHDLGRGRRLVSLLTLELSECNSLSHQLHTILPPLNLVMLIMRRGKFSSIPIQMLRQPFRSFLGISSHEMQAHIAELSPTAHPILFARTLMQLAICLHQVDHTLDTSELCLINSTQQDARRYFDTVSRLVTSQDILVTSLEGLETLMLQGLYMVNLGHLRLGWLTFRRALGVAQLMGLPERPPRKSEKESETTTGSTHAAAQFLWFRLVYSDRFLSLMLGLPFAVADNSFASEDLLAADDPLGRLERIHAVVMGRVITRNEQIGRNKGHDAYTETEDIDTEMQDAARTLPIQWWLLPTLHGTVTKEHIMEVAARLLVQVNHYNLLFLLHLPYLLQDPSAQEPPRNARSSAVPLDYTYSRLTALTACREVVSRFVVFRSLNHVSSCSRSMELKAFIASVGLLLAHLDSHRLGRGNILAHHRPHDLGMVDYVVRRIQDLLHSSNDLLSKSTAQVLKRLIELEADAADGTRYFVQREKGGIASGECMMTNENHVLKISVPYLGTINIARQETFAPQIDVTDRGLAQTTVRALGEYITTLEGNTTGSVRNVLPAVINPGCCSITGPASPLKSRHFGLETSTLFSDVNLQSSAALNIPDGSQTFQTHTLRDPHTMPRTHPADLDASAHNWAFQDQEWT